MFRLGKRGQRTLDSNFRRDRGEDNAVAQVGAGAVHGQVERVVDQPAELRGDIFVRHRLGSEVGRNQIARVSGSVKPELVGLDLDGKACSVGGLHPSRADLFARSADEPEPVLALHSGNVQKLSRHASGLLLGLTGEVVDGSEVAGMLAREPFRLAVDNYAECR
jgi:hypothetical protein